jgi:putative transposase
MRKSRLLEPNAVYHVSVQVNRGEMAFSDEAMRALFLTFIKRAKKRYSFSIYNFCIMGNHIHLVIRPDKGSSLSKIMQWLLGNYAKAWNKAHGVKGHFWGDRFFSRIISSTVESFRRAFEYVSQNPVMAGLVTKMENWEYGGLCHFKQQEDGILDLPGWVIGEYESLCGG